MFLLESGVQNESGNYTFIFVGEREGVKFEEGETYHFKEGEWRPVGSDPFLFLKELYADQQKEWQRVKEEFQLPFVDGFIGYIGYEAVQFVEPVLTPHFRKLAQPLSTPLLYLVRPQLTLIYSHRDFTLHILSYSNRFEEEVTELTRLLSTPVSPLPLKPARLSSTPAFLFDRERFYEMVEVGKEHIRAGDIFQIVLSNRMVVEGEVDKLSFYRLLRATNPSPYLFFLDYGEFAIIGSSPEIMVKKEGSRALVRPIAGTRKRGKTLAEDLEMERELRQDEKERAEHIMLVDLGRNDIGRVCKGGSVEVVDLMRIERYSHVMHLVSDVVGELEEGRDQFDLFKATFPAGTVTGAPKIKAMELIAKYEGVARNFYSGAVGYFGLDGEMDTAIAIRTALWTPSRLYFQAGAGIVADSRPELEYKEINNKLGALLATLKKLERV